MNLSIQSKLMIQ